MKGSLGVEREIGLLRERNDVLSLITVTYKVRNPKTRKLGLLIYKAKNTNEIRREPRGDRMGCERTESESKQRIKSQAETMKKRDTRNAEGRNLEGETKRRLRRARWNR